MSPLPARTFGRVADASLATAIVLAPVAGGSSHLMVLPVLAVIVAIGAVATTLNKESKGRDLHVPVVAIGLLALALFTALQLVPLPGALLELLSPRAAKLRDFVGDGLALRPISYEPAATAREAAKLVILAMAALIAAERSRSAGRFRSVAAFVVIAGLASAAVALVHRALGAERMLGVLPTLRAPHTLVTTFVNPNHAAGFMVLTALCALGLAISAKQRRLRIGWFAAASLLAFVSVLGFSRGGLLALAIGMAILFGGLLRIRQREEGRERALTVPAALIVGVTIAAVAAVIWRVDEVARQYAGKPADPLSLAGKLAAMRDAWPMVLEHPWTGIGRGSYISTYAAYKQYPHQFTFSHAENIIVQSVADWGLLVGPIAVGGLFAAIALRLWSTRSVVAMAAVAGVAAVTAQNFADFSLEILGVGLPVAAILGGAGLGVVRMAKVPVTRMRWALVTLVPLAGLVIGAFALGDLDEDYRHLAAMVRDRVPRESESALGERAARHPSNAVIAAHLSYLAETTKPLDRASLALALRWANRALYLAPTYADAHVTSGRILIIAGHRDQGFGAMRRGWTLAVESPRSDAFIDEIIRLANAPRELVRALPRVDEGSDRIDGAQLARMLRRLLQRKMEAEGRALLAELDARLGELPPEVLLGVADEARRLGDPDRAIALLTRRAEKMPADARTALLLSDIHIAKNDVAGAQAALDSGLAAQPTDALPFHKRAIELALRRQDVDGARQVLDRIRNSMVPTDQNQVMALQLEAKLEVAAGRLGHALSALDNAVRLSPTTTSLRVERARTALKMGRVRDARADIDAVLRQEPGHAEGKRMLAEVDRLPQP